MLTFGLVSQMQADSYKALYDGAWVAHHGIPRRETLAVAAQGRAWVDQQWLAELVYFWAWRAGGYAAVAILAVALVATPYMLLVGLLRRRGVAMMTSVYVTSAAMVPMIGWTFVRAQNFALPLFAALLAFCLTDSDHRRPQLRLALLVPLLALWANMHGSVLLGVLLAVLYLVYRVVTVVRTRQWRTASWCAALALACALTPFATPYGLHIVDYYKEFVGNKAMAAAATEWDVPAFPGFAFFELYVPLAIMLILVVRCSSRMDRSSRVLTAAVAVTALAASRETGSLIWFGMTSGLLVGDLLGRSRMPSLLSRRFLAMVMASAVGFSGYALGSLATRSPADYEGLTAGKATGVVAEYAAARPCTRILADNWDAAALLWHYPWLDGRIAFDARLEQFPQPALASWVTFEVARSARWSRTIRGYQLVVGNAHFTPGLVHRLERLHGAVILARDSRGVAVLSGGAAARICGTGRKPEDVPDAATRG